MRKFIIIFFLFIIPLYSFGQIKRNIDGIILGKSTKQEVVNYLKNRKLPYSFKKVGVYNAILCNVPRSFGGVSWHSTIYIFYNNLVFQVSYSNTDYHLLKKEIDLCFVNLSMALQRKYSQYKITSSDRDNIEYKDSHTSIKLNRGYFENHYTLDVDYTDYQLMEKSFMEGDDDL